jgi:molybdenum cofactor guanylyltransferase
MSTFQAYAPIPAAESWVLAGGRSTRMGRDKALLPFSGRPLIERALDKLRALPLLLPPRIAGSRPDLAQFAAVVEDLHPGCGPLSGIEAALTAASQPLNLFLPVDLPLLPAAFLSLILVRAGITGALVTFARVAGRAQPLCAVYHRALVPHVTASLLRGEYKVTIMLENALRETPHGMDIFDLELLTATCPELLDESVVPAHLWFQNCNSPQELTAIESFAKG